MGREVSELKPPEGVASLPPGTVRLSNGAVVTERSTAAHAEHNAKVARGEVPPPPQPLRPGGMISATPAAIEKFRKECTWKK